MNTMKGNEMTTQITIKSSALFLLDSPEDKICEDLSGQYTEDQVLDTWTSLFKNSTTRKFGKGTVYTFTITSQLEKDVLGAVVESALGYQVTQNMFNEFNKSTAMETYLEKIEKEIWNINIGE